MLNRHATSKINTQNAIKTQGRAAMIIRKCNHKHQTRLIARLRLLIRERLVSRHIGSNAEENNMKKNVLMCNLPLFVFFFHSYYISKIKTARKDSAVGV